MIQAPHVQAWSRQIPVDALTPDLSVVFGTYNRFQLLRQALNSVRHACGHAITREIIIVDGGSTDGSLEYLRTQDDVTLIEHGELRGPVAAYNDGFAHATGNYVAYINDDLVLQAGSLAAAVDILDTKADVGIVALQYQNPGSRVFSSPLCTAGKHQYPFASFGVVRRDLGDVVGWFDGFYWYYGDCHLCVKIQKMGYRLDVLPAYVAKHSAADNDLRGENRWNGGAAKARARQDGERWAEMWREGK